MARVLQPLASAPQPPGRAAQPVRVAKPRPGGPGTTYSDRSVHGQVVHELGRRIIGGQYAPGSVLPNEDALSAEFNVSRTALREATKMLAAKGLVESRPKVGTRVRPAGDWNTLDADVLAWRCATLPDARFVRSLTEMREIVEPGAAALAARNRTPEQLAAIEAAFAAMAAARDIDAWVEADLAFHRAILDATGNELIVPLGSLIGTALGTLFGISARKAEDFKVSLGDHERVLMAIRSGDHQGAWHAMSYLLSDTRRRLASSIIG